MIVLLSNLGEAKMRIHRCMSNKPNTFKYNGKMQSNASSLRANRVAAKHKYTGVASADLAYASMFDNEIAKDLKLMGLI